MHTLDARDFTFHYNSDLSGDVEIVDKAHGTSFLVSGEDARGFVSLIAEQWQEQAEENGEGEG